MERKKIDVRPRGSDTKTALSEGIEILKAEREIDDLRGAIYNEAISDMMTEIEKEILSIDLYCNNYLLTEPLKRVMEKAKELRYQKGPNR